jgi:hypothetical protein
MTMKCNTCKLDKDEGEMYVRAGKVIRTCRSCRQAQVDKATSSRARTMQSVKISRPVKAQASSPPAPTIGHPVLELLPGWGVNASIDEERLVLKQSDAEGNVDEIALSRSETRALFAHFATWAA